MKRSDALKLIADIVEDNGYESYLSIEEEAEKILSTLEQTGIQPPGRMKPIPFEKDGKQHPLIPGDFKNEQGVWCTPGVNEWEPEDV